MYNLQFAPTLTFTLLMQAKQFTLVLEHTFIVLLTPQGPVPAVPDVGCTTSRSQYITRCNAKAGSEQCLKIAPSSFLSKDLSPLALIQAVELAILQQVPTDEGQVSIVKVPVLPQNAVKYIFIKNDEGFKPLNPEEVSYFFAKGKMTYAKIGKSNLAINILMKTLEKELNLPFWRIHKTYLVNTALIEIVNTKDNIVEIGNERLPIGHTYRKAFLGYLKLQR
jgi:DNA-binding LytR/AlgR family response regulator